MSTDTSERDAGEESTRHGLGDAAFFRSVVETTTAPLAVVDGDGRVAFVNDAFGDVVGRDADALVGTPFEGLVERAALPTNGTDEWTTTVRGDDPTTVTLSAATAVREGTRLTTVTVRDRDGDREDEPRTVSSRPAAEESIELRASRERYRRLLDAAPDAIVTADANTGEVLDANEAAADLFGRPRAALVGRHQTDLHPSEDAEEYRAVFDDHAETGGVFDEDEVREVVRADGTRVPVEINAGVTDLPGGRVIQGIFRDVSDRTERERELAANRDELARLDRVNNVIREVVQTLVEAETPEQVERDACERLVDAEPYVFAWFGANTPRRSDLSVRARAGEGGSFVGTAATIDVDEESTCPVGRAIATHSVQVVGDLDDYPDDEGWRARALEEGLRSCAAVPIVHDGRRFGVLTVYSDQGDVFDERERAVLADLGGALGHALNALERKAALMGDTVREVEFRTTDHVEALVEEVGEDGRATFERTIPTGEEYLQYVRVENVENDRFETIVDSYPWCVGWRCIRDGEPSVYELRTTRPSLTSKLASHGGRVRTAVVEGGAVRVLAELPQNADVRSLLAALKEGRSDIELVAQRTVPRSDHPDRARISLEERLSDRQQSALEVAYYAGYFEWPRDSTAEDVAESLGVSSPTVHKHLRRAHDRILEALLDRPDVHRRED